MTFEQIKSESARPIYFIQSKLRVDTPCPFYLDEDDKVTRLTDGVFVTGLLNTSSGFFDICTKEEAIVYSKEFYAKFRK